MTAEKLEQAESQLAHSGRMGGFFMPVQRKKEVWKAIDSSAISYVFTACSLCSIIICPEHMSKTELFATYGLVAWNRKSHSLPKSHETAPRSLLSSCMV